MTTSTCSPSRTTTKHRRRRCLAAVALSALVLTGCLAGHARTFLDRTNQLRSSRGIPALQHHSTLEAKAQHWAEVLAARGTLDHSRLSDGLDGLAWRSLGENVARGTASGDWSLRLHETFVASTAHRANLLDRRFTHIGVGIAAGGGKVYVVEVFAQL